LKEPCDSLVGRHLPHFAIHRNRDYFGLHLRWVFLT
jgi:hypothetical protein